MFYYKRLIHTTLTFTLLFSYCVSKGVTSNKTIDKSSINVFRAVVIKVADGDSFTVQRRGEKVRVRLFGIDCPEINQSYGQEAREFTNDLVYREIITIKVITTDRYNRIVGKVTLPNGKSLNRELLRVGLAWHYKKYSHDKRLSKLEKRARKLKRGLWKDNNPIPPWVFRQMKK